MVKLQYRNQVKTCFGKWRELNSQLHTEQQFKTVCQNHLTTLPTLLKKNYVAGCHVAKKADNVITHNPL
ncbi:hypothetical protein Hanom_Chr08g00692071 [Helianthus anomalus]